MTQAPSRPGSPSGTLSADPAQKDLLITPRTIRKHVGALRPLREHDQTLSPLPHSGTLTTETGKTVCQASRSERTGRAGEAKTELGTCAAALQGCCSVRPEGQGHSPELHSPYPR